MRSLIIRIIILLHLTVLLYGCASVGVPSGGPLDEDPPVMVKSTPMPNTLNYDKDKIVIEFDELIQLKEMFQKFVASPPFNEAPTVEAYSNKLFVKFKEDLQPNTTYTLDFADGIADNNEGNVLDHFSFSFSTGEVIDSFRISGHVWDADNLAPAKGTLVMLHDNLNDTAINTLVPLRLAKTNSVGYFSILNVSPGNYRLYALEDYNRDYKFDQPGELMAWTDSIIIPATEYRMVIDSVAIDSTLAISIDSMQNIFDADTTTNIVYDSISNKFIESREDLFFLPDSLQLFLFEHDYKTQYLTSEERKEKAKLTFFFNRPLEKDLEIGFLGKDDSRNQFIMERSLKNDTVTFWMKDSAFFNKDSLGFVLKYIMRDSLDNPYLKQDTLSMYFFEMDDGKKKKEKKRKKKKVPTATLR